MLSITCSQPELRATLLERAARYCPDAADRDLLVSRTVSAVCDYPDLIAGPRIKVAFPHHASDGATGGASACLVD